METLRLGLSTLMPWSFLHMYVWRAEVVDIQVVTDPIQAHLLQQPVPLVRF